jgi:hypothetical protein
MSHSYTSIKFSYDNANRFVRDVISTSFDKIVKYVFIGNSNAYANSDTEIPELIDNVVEEKKVWDTMFAAKKLSSNDVELAIPRNVWTANTVYKQFDDTVLLEDLFCNSLECNVSSMFVINSEGNVYKCLDNDNNSLSVTEPLGDYSSSNGFISTINNSGDRSYLWKFMYNIKNGNKFVTQDWIPVPSGITSQEYGSSPINIIDGSLASIVVTANGAGYVDSNIGVADYISGTNIITVANTIYTNVNMYVDGTGILPKTYITALNPLTRQITLSVPVSSNGSGEISLKTRAIVEGDGRNTELEVFLSNTSVQKISVPTIGSGYSRANVKIYGTGTGASARAILPPKYGHGYNPALELGAKSVIINTKFGEIDSTENNMISIDTAFRQYGVLSNPHLYGNTDPLSIYSANDVISQTLDLTLLPGSDFELNEIVFQGTQLSNSTFSGIVHAQDSDVNNVRLINTKGTPLVGSLLKGNLVSRVVSSIKYPEFDPYSGDILYAQNISPINRYDGQAENVKLVLKF